ncbi:hypothetical protein SPRG_03046 [Saprolegnia parasitica CBS 223.65]|uniref:Uncharacterized protein n=1 Tax=Saprolegnia parasitica (strain CBS 223.65) TaxID=695850 RepID=A0A067D0K3_SAPPC|nr:hypothetical protein SPRG_03046 [Saprolegnia parasitica CBS 223.65]KDO32572.1 hypothetical protein SPRG_03046 [Saprolegnia parasitica CBS 223.65]|eukprot:XP_012197017.1 hypothetical protein SPRG_03046 [Saprolegnia parasitica CBS 223.65]
MDVTVGAMLKTIQCLKQAPSTDELRREENNYDARAKATDEERLKLRFKTMRMNKVFVTYELVAAAVSCECLALVESCGRSNQCGIIPTDDEIAAPVPQTPAVARKQSLRDFEVISQEAGDKVIFRALGEKRNHDVEDASTLELTRWDRDEW